MTKDRISEFEDRTVEFTQSEQRKHKLKKTWTDPQVPVGQ